MRIPITIRLRFPGEGSSAQGKSGPKERPKGVSDGQQVEMTANTAYALSITWYKRERSNPLIDGLASD